MRHAKLIALLLTGTLLASFPAFAGDEAGPDPLAKADSDMKEVLDAQAGLNPKPIETLTPAEARRQPTPSDGVKLVMNRKHMDPTDPMGVATKNVSVGGKLEVRIYTPDDASGKEPLPVIVYYHGGGWVIADLDTYDATPRAIAKAANAIVISAEYRHAPEHKFPAAHEDAFTAYQWALKKAASLGGDPSRVAVMGESAGANLAINVAIAARDGNVPLPVHEVLVYPVAGSDMNTLSYRENEYAKPLNKAMMAWFVKHTVSTDEDKHDPRINLVGKADLHGLPPTTVITAEIDPLRSEGEALAEKLKKAGVSVHAKNYDGVTHEFFGMGLVVSKAKDAEELAVSDLKTSFANGK